MGGNDGVKEEETDEIIEQDGGIYNVVSQHKISQATNTLTHNARTIQ